MPMDIDREFLENKLQGYKLVDDLQTIKVNDHCRYTSNKYKQDGRKCAYIIIKSIDKNGVLTVNSYKPQYDDWKIDPFNQYKKFRFYKKDEPVYTGECSKCGFKPLRNPYTTCLDCRPVVNKSLVSDIYND
jgi:hypothetical protein